MGKAAVAFGARSLVYLLAFFPIFYLAYKFHTPELGGNDYLRYYEMYLHPLDFSVSQEPWVLRQIQAVIVNLLVESGFDYDTEIAFSNAAYARGVFFSALTVNYLSVVLTAALLGGYLQRQIQRADLVSWCLPAVMVLNFSILFFAFSGLTEGLSLLMFTATYLAYRSGRYITSALIVLAAALQRELIPIILFALVAADLLTGGTRQGRRGRFAVLLCAALSLAAHILLRMRISDDTHSDQLSPSSWVDALSAFSLADTDFIFQVFLTQNLAFIVILAAVLFVAATGRAPRIDRWLTLDCCVTFGVILIVGIAASVGNNIGRLLIFCSPTLALILAGIARDWAVAPRAP